MKGFNNFMNNIEKIIKKLLQFNLVLFLVICYNPKIGIASYIEKSLFFTLLIFSLILTFVNWKISKIWCLILNFTLLLSFSLIRFVSIIENLCIMKPKIVTIRYVITILQTFLQQLPQSIFFYIIISATSILFCLLLQNIKKYVNMYVYSFIILGIYGFFIDFIFLFINHIPFSIGNLRPIFLNLLFGIFLQIGCLLIYEIYKKITTVF